MKQVYYFSIASGMSSPSARKMTLLHNMGCPLELIARSREYDVSDDCTKQCIHFVNSQLPFLEERFTTVLESNPFIDGTAMEMDNETVEYHVGRWNEGEIMKVHAADPKDTSTEIFPLTCSIYMKNTYSGFMMEGNEAVN